MPSTPGAGLLAYRQGSHGVEVLLFRRARPRSAGGGRDLLSIPVWGLGRPQDAAEPVGRPFDSRPRVKQRAVAKRSLEQLLERARAGFAALTGLRPPGPYLPLGGVKMRLHRVVYVWACETAEAAPALLAAERGSPAASPASREDGRASGLGRPSYAAAAFLPLAEARAAIDPQQRRFLDQLEGLLTRPPA